LNCIAGTTDYGALRKCDFVIEAATENEALKVKILKQVVEHRAQETVHDEPWRIPHHDRRFTESLRKRVARTSVIVSCSSRATMPRTIKKSDIHGS